jgi:FkbM family methyltransferase
MIGRNLHGLYCLPDESIQRPAARRILAGAVHEPETLAFILDNCRAGDVIHAGAYFGDFLPAISKSLAPGAILWAFEPNPENFRCTRITVGLNRLGNTVLMPMGLGAKQTIARLKVRDESGRSLGGGSRIAPDGIPVDLIRLDDMPGADRHISLIHLDIEGHEKAALAGAVGILQVHRPVVILETWGAQGIKLEGYRPVREVEGNTIYQPVV